MAGPSADLERDALLRHLVEHVRDYAIFLLDPTGHVRTWNEGAQRIKGYAAREIIGKHFSTFFPPDDVARKRPSTLLEAARRNGRYEEESWRVRKDGTEFWANVVITALHSDDTGELIGFAKITRDLTERRRRDEERMELLRQEREARAQAEATLRSLRAAHEQVSMAETALRARDEFLAVAAHELKTPVTALKASAQLLLRRASRQADADPQHRAALEVIDRQVTKLAILVTHLLEVSRIQGNRMALQVEPTDLVGLTREVSRSLGASANRQILVRGPETLTAVIDPLRVEQVITNLLDNALKFSPDDGPVEVDLSRADRDRVRVTVTDRGSGVPPDQRERLFTQFFQAHPDRSGMGLGLYISKAIAERHGGRLEASFPESGGSRFELTIPAGADLRPAG